MCGAAFVIYSLVLNFLFLILGNFSYDYGISDYVSVTGVLFSLTKVSCYYVTFMCACCKVLCLFLMVYMCTRDIIYVLLESLLFVGDYWFA